MMHYYNTFGDQKRQFLNDFFVSQWTLKTKRKITGNGMAINFKNPVCTRSKRVFSTQTKIVLWAILCCFFYSVQTANKCSIRIADDRIRTGALWCELWSAQSSVPQLMYHFAGSWLLQSLLYWMIFSALITPLLIYLLVLYKLLEPLTIDWERFPS